MVKLNWADVFKGNTTLIGTIVLNIISDNELQVIDQTGGWSQKGEMLIKISNEF